MSERLPLVEPFDRAHSYCAYCPKLCRHSCPVSTVEARETTTPWGKMTSLHHVAKGNLPLEEAHAATWYACTGCLRCKSYCDHDNPVAHALGAGRAEAMRARVAPKAAYAIIERHAEREERAARRGRELFGDDAPSDAAVAFVPGCSACVTRPESAKKAAAVVEALSDGPVRVLSDRCCGLPLLEAGDVDGFKTSAQRFIDALDGYDAIIFQDPGCLEALAVRAPAFEIDHDLPLAHLVDLASEKLDRLAPIERSGSVRYHDACKLGRGLGKYEAPRKILQKILGADPEELYMSHELAECSGAGGQVPRIYPETSDAIADERLAAHHRAGGGTLVSACPAAVRKMAKRAGEDGPEVIELVDLLASSVGA